MNPRQYLSIETFSETTRLNKTRDTRDSKYLRLVQYSAQLKEYTFLFPRIGNPADYKPYHDTRQ